MSNTDECSNNADHRDWWSFVDDDKIWVNVVAILTYDILGILICPFRDRGDKIWVTMSIFIACVSAALWIANAVVTIIVKWWLNRRRHTLEPLLLPKTSPHPSVVAANSNDVCLIIGVLFCLIGIVVILIGGFEDDNGRNRSSDSIWDKIWVKIMVILIVLINVLTIFNAAVTIIKWWVIRRQARRQAALPLL